MNEKCQRAKILSHVHQRGLRKKTLRDKKKKAFDITRKYMKSCADVHAKNKECENLIKNGVTTDEYISNLCNCPIERFKIPSKKLLDSFILARTRKK